LECTKILISVINGSRVLLTGLLLVGTFVTICFAGPVGVYLALVAALVGLVFLPDLPGLRAALQNWGVRGVILSFFVIWVSFLPSARSVDDVLAFVDFLAFPVVVPAVALLARFANSRNVAVVAGLATFGALATLAVGLYEVHVLGYLRAQGNGDSSSIFFSGMAALLCFFSLLGVLNGQTRWRWLFLIGNAAGVAAIILGGTRGAMLAYAVLLMVAILSEVAYQRRSLFRRLSTIAVILASILLAAGLSNLDRVQTLATITAEVATQSAVSDTATSLRLAIYNAAIQSFLDSPLYGHGWWKRFAAAVPYMGELGVEVHARDNHAHLHNDILNFGSAGGVIAILGYLILMASPILGAWTSPRTENWRIRVTAAIGLVGAYLAMGAVDVMFVFEIPKSMFVLCTAVILGFFLDVPPGRGREAKAG
jgi:O-antigen ligase